MSSQLQTYRWNDKPVAFKQGLLAISLTLALTFLYWTFRGRHPARTVDHIFTQAKQDQARDQTLSEMAKKGVKPAETSGRPPSIRAQSHTLGSATRSGAQSAIQERPLFDGMMATLEAVTDRNLTSTEGDNSAEATVVGLLSTGTLIGTDNISGAKLMGQFQANFDTRRIQIQFRELSTQDGRRYSVAGVAMDENESAIGIPADYSSGVGLRVLGATLGTAINTAEVMATSHVLQNESGADAIVSRELNQAAAESLGHATSTIGDEATRDLKTQKSVLSLPAGTRFRIKLRAIPPSQGGAR